MDVKTNKYFWLAAAGILAGWGGTVSDVLLLYNPSGDYFAPDFAFLAGIDPARAFTALMIGLVAIPLLLLPLPVVLPLLKNISPPVRKTAIVLAVLIVPVGLSCHYSFYRLICAYHESAGNITTWIAATQITSAAMSLLFFGAFAGLLWMTLSGKINGPRWLAFFNPVVTYPLWMLAWWLVPAAGYYLFPAGFNLSAGIFWCGIAAASDEITS